MRTSAAAPPIGCGPSLVCAPPPLLHRTAKKTLPARYSIRPPAFEGAVRGGCRRIARQSNHFERRMVLQFARPGCCCLAQAIAPQKPTPPPLLLPGGPSPHARACTAIGPGAPIAALAEAAGRKRAAAPLLPPTPLSYRRAIAAGWPAFLLQSCVRDRSGRLEGCGTNRTQLQVISRTRHGVA